MTICAKCGRASPPEFRYCGGCGSELAERLEYEERKVITVLFCDLVGFTAASEHRDPEDVSRDLDVYYGEARRQIERFGGVVEKFVGDAVVGVWGAPVGREDDPRRATLAALGIVSAVGADVRIGINTGEVLVKIHARPELGEAFVAGDVVNTAARIQGAAPVGAILVGDRTARLTRQSIAYEHVPPVHLKGKSDPVVVWRLAAAIPGDDVREPTPFVGRAGDFALLSDTFDRAVAERGPRLVTILGEPGIGKSRLVSEFVQSIAQSRNVVVLRGSCVAYGDGTRFWALGDVVKARAGILATDTPSEAGGKLDDVVTGMRDEQWLRACLAPLVGLGDHPGERDEVFAAWRGFLEEIATPQPLVVVLEDLQWADDAMLDFVEQLPKHSAGAPMAVVCTARPELLDKRPEWEAGSAGSTSRALRPLSDGEMAQLAGLLIDTDAPESTRGMLIERAGGNPLYAEEYGRLLGEQDRPDGGDASLPESVHSVIAARLDALAPELKQLLHDASVIGRVFWLDALASVTGRPPANIAVDLPELARRQLIRRATASSVHGDEEYAFSHDLIRDVAYAQLPRRRRADRHRGVAEWIERTASERIGDRAELVAYHYGAAFSLTQATRMGEPEPLRRAALRFTALAAEHAIGVDTERGRTLAATGLDLAEPADPERAGLLCVIGTCQERDGDLDGAAETLAEAIEAAELSGLTAIQIRAGLRRELLLVVHRGATTIEELGEDAERACRILDRLDDRIGVAEAWFTLGEARYWLGRFGAAETAYAHAIEAGRRARAPRIVANATAGFTAALLEGPAPVADALERVRKLRAASNDPLTELRLLAVGACLEAFAGRPDVAYAQLAESAEIARRLGGGLLGIGFHSEAAYVIASAAGRPEDAEAAQRNAINALEKANDEGVASTRIAYMAQIEYSRGHLAEADRLARHTAQLSCAEDDYATEIEWRLVAAKVAAATGDSDRAERMAQRAVEIAVATESFVQTARAFEDAAHVEELLGRPAEAGRFLERAMAIHEQKGNVLALERLRAAAPTAAR